LGCVFWVGDTPHPNLPPQGGKGLALSPKRGRVGVEGELEWGVVGCWLIANYKED